MKPGTPLEMSIELDRLSSDIYGVMVSNMEGGNSILFSVVAIILLRGGGIPTVRMTQGFAEERDILSTELPLPHPGHGHQRTGGDPHPQRVSLAVVMFNM